MHSLWKGIRNISRSRWAKIVRACQIDGIQTATSDQVYGFATQNNHLGQVEELTKETKYLKDKMADLDAAKSKVHHAECHFGLPLKT